jgi:pimeloyl-ACP methyl ester carboxylesterase
MWMWAVWVEENSGSGGFADGKLAPRFCWGRVAAVHGIGRLREWLPEQPFHATTNGPERKVRGFQFFTAHTGPPGAPVFFCHGWPASRLLEDEAHYSLAIRRRREILADLLASGRFIIIGKGVAKKPPFC